MNQRSTMRPMDCRGLLLGAVCWWGSLSFLLAGEQTLVLRDYLQQGWTNELLNYPFSAPEGACLPESVALTGPRGLVPVQLSGIDYWPGAKSVKSATLSFIANLAPLASDTYTVHYGKFPPATTAPTTDLKVTSGSNTVDVVTRQFGVRLVLGEKAYPAPVSAAEVPGPVQAMRLAVPAPEPAAGGSAGGTWFGGSRMFGPGKIVSWSAKLVEAGPVFARVAIRYTYADGNTLDLTVQVAAGDNTMRMETRVAKDQPQDGFDLVLSRGLPPLIFLVQDESRNDRDCFPSKKPGGWEEVPLKDYTVPKRPWPPEGWPDGLVTQLSPWEDWFSSFTQRTLRLKMENTTRELQIHSLDPGAWVEPRSMAEVFNPDSDSDPAKGSWIPWWHKMMPLTRDKTGEVFLQVNAAGGIRKWTVSECLSSTGAGDVMGSKAQGHSRQLPKVPAEAGPTIGQRLNEVKDYVLSWPGDEGRHPRLFLNRQELKAAQERQDPAVLEKLRQRSAQSPNDIADSPCYDHVFALENYLLTGSNEVATKFQLVTCVRKALQAELKGVMFGAGSIPAVLYDGVVDSSLVSAEERAVLRAQMAYYGYRLADPATWSAERGYATPNINMTLSWLFPIGMVACAIPEHPMAKTWHRSAQCMLEEFLNRTVGEGGEWPETVPHGRAGIDDMLAFAIASKNAGFHDYVSDPRMKRLLLWQAKMLTPRDPRPRGGRNWQYVKPNQRYVPAHGRDPMSDPWGSYGVMARALRDTDPELSAMLQWSWLENGACAEMSKLCGFAPVYFDKRLPSKVPAWPSEVFPRFGLVMRHGLGTENEHQVMLFSGDHFAALYPPNTGSLPSIFAYGTPVAGCFPGCTEYQEGFLNCHVALARGLGTLTDRNQYGYHGCARDISPMCWPPPGREVARFGEHGGLGNVSAFSTLPHQDYAAVDVALHCPRTLALPWRKDLPEWPPVPVQGKPPVDWRRQVLFLKDDDPAKTAYLLIRDSVKGGQPTMWQMWTVSEKIGTPEEAKDLAAFLKDKPGNTICPARELKGDRFTAVGQLGVDVEYYLAAPTDTPRYTLRWGVSNLVADYVPIKVPEYQDLLHLQMPGDGAYYVAFFPRKRDQPAPTFQTLGEGTIIKVSGDFGTDYGFLSALEASGAGEGVSFRGTAASVQDRKRGMAMVLGAKGEVRYKTYGLAADFPVGIRVHEKELIVEWPDGIQPPAFQRMQPFPGGAVTVTAPGHWVLANPVPGVKFSPAAAGFVLEVPAGLKTVTVVTGN